MTGVIDSWLESSVTFSDAAWIKPSAAHSLLPCKRFPFVGRILEQSPCGWHWEQEDWGKEERTAAPTGLCFMPTLSLDSTSVSVVLFHSTYSQFLSAVSSRCVSCVLGEVESGRPADWIQFSGFLTGPLDGHYRKSTLLLWSLKH